MYQLDKEGQSRHSEFSKTFSVFSKDSLLSFPLDHPGDFLISGG